MFSDLYDSISLLFSRRWPKAEGVITAVDARTIYFKGQASGFRLVVVYEFSIGADGPYTGESASPQFREDGMNITDQFAVGRAVSVRYRADDPSVNKLDPRTWQVGDGV